MKTATEERAEIDARRDKITLQASTIGLAAMWLETNATKLAAIGVGDYATALIGQIDADYLIVYVYGDVKKQTQTVEAFRQAFGGKWTVEPGATVYVTCPLTEDFAIALFVGADYEETTTKESR